MKKIKSLATLGLALALTTGLAACSSSNNDAPAEETAAAETSSETVKIGFTAMNLTDPFQIAVRDTVKELAEAKGWEFQSGDGNGDNAKQINLCEDMINGGITHLILCPVSQDGILPILELCQEKGVKVINYDSAVTDRDLVECFVASDNYSAGKIDADYLNEKYPEGGEMLIIDNPKAESVVARVKGLTENLNENFVVVNDYAISTLDEVLTGTEDTLQTHPNLKFIFGLNDSCGLISLGAVQSAGRDDIVVVSVDGSPDGQASIADGGLMATAAQSPITIGEEVFKALEKVVAGEEVSDVDVPCFIISQENISEFDITQWH